MRPTSNNSLTVLSPDAVAERDADSIIKSRLLRAECFSIDDQKGLGSFLGTLVECTGWSESYAIEAIDEYKRFMVLQSLDVHRKLSPSMIVDSVWHLHLLYTVNYQQFCRSVLDTDFIHHEPSKGNVEEEQNKLRIYYETLIAYVQVFSSSPPSSHWGTSSFMDMAIGDAAS